jgi:hypothetical protein
VLLVNIFVASSLDNLLGRASVASAADKYVPVGVGASELELTEIEQWGDALLQNYVKVPNLKD